MYVGDSTCEDIAVFLAEASRQSGLASARRSDDHNRILVLFQKDLFQEAQLFAPQVRSNREFATRMSFHIRSRLLWTVQLNAAGQASSTITRIPNSVAVPRRFLSITFKQLVELKLIG
jgi:hypothetical protein